jgi:beta-lactamase regulating signal transducer with metallopeptidase domain
LKLLIIILLVVWIAPSVLLFFYLVWKNDLLARHLGSLKMRFVEGSRTRLSETNVSATGKGRG